MLFTIFSFSSSKDLQFPWGTAMHFNALIKIKCLQTWFSLPSASHPLEDSLNIHFWAPLVSCAPEREQQRADGCIRQWEVRTAWLTLLPGTVQPCTHKRKPKSAPRECRDHVGPPGRKQIACLTSGQGVVNLFWFALPYYHRMCRGSSHLHILLSAQTQTVESSTCQNFYFMVPWHVMS